MQILLDIENLGRYRHLHSGESLKESLVKSLSSTGMNLLKQSWRQALGRPRDHIHNNLGG
jgi:hypothetical protein